MKRVRNMNSKEEFTIQMKKKVAEIEEILKTYLPEAEGYQSDYGSDGIQSDGGRKKTASDADAGDMQTFWRRACGITAFYGST